ncbi:MAG: hypothetical protein JW991_04210, partial [Candidatus Pacebacteria bacterium]|nr:hypothetical protein [Candidatus Paceibacterota bacterium]
YSDRYNQPLLLIATFAITFLSLLAVMNLKKPRATFSKKARISFFLFFLFLLGLFLANGDKYLTGVLYREIYNSSKIFWIFREPWVKFTPLMMFSLPLLMTGTLDNWRRKSKKIYYLGLGLLMVCFGLVNHPFFTGEATWTKWNGTMRSWQVRIPDYWQQLKQFLDQKNLNKARLMIFPRTFYGMAYNWPEGYSGWELASIILPNPVDSATSMVMYPADRMINQLFDFLPKPSFNLENYLSLLNIDLILQENDVDWRFPGNISLSPSQMGQILKDRNFKKIADFGKFTEDYLSQIPNEEPDIKLREELDRELVGLPALTLYRPEKKKVSLLHCPREVILSNGDWQSLPEIVSLPNYQIGSAIYLGDQWQEMAAFQGETVGNNFILIVEPEGYFKEERLGERLVPVEIGFSNEELHWLPGSWVYPWALKWEKYQQWKIKDDPLALFDRKISLATKRITELTILEPDQLAQLKDPFINYREEIGKALTILEQFRKEEKKNFLRYFNKLKGALWVHREKIRELMLDWRLRNEFDQLVTLFESRLESLEIKTNFSQLSYQFNIPQEGRYEIYLQDSTLGWENIGAKNFTAGQKQLAIPLREKNRALVDRRMRIVPYSAESIYRVSFNYQSDTQLLKVYISEGELGQVTEQLLPPTYKDKKHYEFFFRSSSGAEKAFLHLPLWVEDLEIERIYQPKLLLRLRTEKEEFCPEISFEEESPVLYRLKVKGAKKPFNLVFSESFHPGWQIRWGKKIIADDRHWQVNGFANSWYVTPQDVAGEPDYELSIEFEAQRLFYQGLMVSGLALGGSLIVVLVTWLKRRRGKD